MVSRVWLDSGVKGGERGERGDEREREREREKRLHSPCALHAPHRAPQSIAPKWSGPPNSNPKMVWLPKLEPQVSVPPPT